MRHGIVLLAMMAFMLGDLAQAQTPWGSGLYPAVARCPYGGAADGSTSDSDEVQALKQEKSDLKKEIRNAKKLADGYKRLEEKYKNNISTVLVDEAADTVFNHIDNRLSKDDYFDNCAAADIQAQGTPVTGPATDTRHESPGDGGGVFCVPLQGGHITVWTYNQQNILSRVANPKHYSVWLSRFAEDNGRVNTDICSASKRNGLAIVKSGVQQYQQDLCKKDIGKYEEISKKYAEKEADIARWNERLSEIDSQIDESRLEAEEAKLDGDTEADTCFSCNLAKEAPSLLTTVGGIAAEFGLGYLGYKGVKDAIHTNARLGWPSNPWMASVPWMVAGQNIYGILAGGMNGRGILCGGSGVGFGPYGALGPMGPFGLAGYMGMGGPFGYPYSMYNPYAGGMFNGCGPWGCPGMMYPGGMMPGMGYMSGYMAGISFMGMPMGGGYMGMPMMGGYMGMPMGGGYMGMPMMGGYMGMPMMGGYMGMPMMGGYMGMPMMGGYMGMPMGGGYMGAMGGALGSQFQMQLMQEYTQQMNMWMQQQQQAQAQYANKVQVVGQLQQEIYQIQMQIQQVSSGSYFGVGTPGIGAGIGVGVGVGVTSPILPITTGSMR